MAVATSAATSPAHAQSPESDPAPGVKLKPPPPKGFLIPDVPDTLLKKAEYHDPRFTFTFGIALLVDYTAFSQNDASKTQVGVQDNRSELRDARLTFRGTFRLAGQWRYFIQPQYNGFDVEPGDDKWQIAELSLRRDLGPRLGSITFGKVKQTLSYEMVGDAANLPQSERLMSPFFTSRDIGIKLSNTMLPDKRGTWAVGWFNDWWVKDVSWSKSGHQVTTRLTYLPVWADSGTRYLHLGLAGRYNGADNSKLKYQGRPESNVADLYVDAGSLSSDHAWHLGLEGLWADGPFSVLGEYLQAWVSSREAGDPTFHGWYLTGSWIVTGGNSRVYDRNVGFARRVPVSHRHGEVELVGRFGQVDLDDANVSGGSLNKSYFGVNWWATKRWKAGFGYGNADLDRFDTSGRTQIFLWRLQWIY